MVGEVKGKCGHFQSLRIPCGLCIRSFRLPLDFQTFEVSVEALALTLPCWATYLKTWFSLEHSPRTGGRRCVESAGSPLPSLPSSPCGVCGHTQLRKLSHPSQLVSSSQGVLGCSPCFCPVSDEVTPERGLSREGGGMTEGHRNS